MKKVLTCVLLLAAAVGIYVSTVFISAWWHNREISAAILRVNRGISREDLDAIMGSPERIHMTDGPELIFCYTRFPFDDYDENCGDFVTVSNDRVVRTSTYR